MPAPETRCLCLTTGAILQYREDATDKKGERVLSDFSDFKKYFKECQKRFGLNGYKVYFEYKPLENCFANITVDQRQMVATVALNSDDKKHPDKHVKHSAKHEAIHLLLFKLQHIASCRYCQPEELDEAIEEAVFKLEDLIKD